MARTKSPRIVSANALLEGDVVYLAAEGGWTRDLASAAVAADDAEAEAYLAAADQPAKVVGSYLVDVELDASGFPTPLHFREAFRDRGPTNRPDLGRQATGGA